MDDTKFKFLVSLEYYKLKNLSWEENKSYTQNTTVDLWSVRAAPKTPSESVASLLSEIVYTKMEKML